MSTFNLLDVAKSYFNHDLINKAASSLGESESGISKAVSAILPAVITGISEKASTTEGATTIAKLATEEHNDGILDSISGFLHHDSSSSLISKSSNAINAIFGKSGQSNMLTNLISNFAGIKSSSTGTILSMAVPLVLGLLGRHTSQNNVSASDLSSLLDTQKSLATAALPAGFSLSSGSSAPSINASHSHSNYTPDTERKTRSFLGWLIPLILLALLAVAAYYMFSKGCNGSDHKEGEVTVLDSTDHSGNGAVTHVTAEKGMLDTVSGDFLYNEGDITTIILPNDGGELKVGKNSTEARLVAFLNDKDAMIDTVKGNWFEFTNVHFKTGSSDLTDVSAAQLKNLVAIAKAYPAAKFKFGGYTDNTGDAAKNVTLSQKRADAVSAMTNKLGAPAGAIESAKGYGQEWPIEDNATAEGRAMNRRVAVNVKAK
jgi:OOP family OmpA-OmpF porin